MAPAWTRLIRYISAQDGVTRLGDPIVPSDQKHPDIDALALAGGLKVKVLQTGTNHPVHATPTDQEDVVKTLLGPLTPQDVPIVRCVGLNYKTHILETGFDLPENPTLFIKSPMTVADTRQPTPIPKLGQLQLDYEGELTIVIGKDAKNVSEEDVRFSPSLCPSPPQKLTSSLYQNTPGPLLRRRLHIQQRRLLPGLANGKIQSGNDASMEFFQILR